MHVAIHEDHLEGLAALDSRLVGLTGLLPVGGEGDLVTLVLEHAADHLHVELIVLHHEDAARVALEHLGAALRLLLGEVSLLVSIVGP